MLRKYNWLVSVINKYWYLYLIIIGLLIIDGLINWFFPNTIRQILNFNIPEGNTILLNKNLIMLGCITLVSLICTLSLNYLFTLIGNKSTYEIEKLFIKKTFDFNGNDIREKNNMLMGILFRDIYLLQDLFSKKIFSFVGDMLFLAVTLFFLASIDITFVIPIIIIYPVLIIVTCLMKKVIKRQVQDLAVLRDKSNSFIKEYISNLYELIAYKGRDYFINRYIKVRSEVVDKQIVNNLTTDSLNLVIGVLNCIALIIFLVIGSNKVINNTMSLGDLSIFILYVNRLFGPIGRILNFILNLTHIKVCFERINIVLEESVL
ncbi:ABC transporter transmembrane domain-containing protein [Clostridium gasigenes]|uniref:ABC transporter transmembrane domain-containing protein n=1 Tax=Clostridium gasigenes TaxID=94869 RepID=UPI00311AA7A3